MDSSCPPTVDEINRMRDAFPYRGPDDWGSLVIERDGLALGHRRLSILDLSEMGRQPMSLPEKDLHVVFNGEIYNYLEIKSDLQKTGYTFRTGTDTEVLIKAYDLWGAECLQKFVGMFAFAIWDGERKQLFLARDRLGKKPLYYCRSGDRFLFASEVKAILAALERKPSVDHTLIDSYMSFGYIPGENTLHKGIKRLLPGCCLLLSRSGLSIRQYWDLRFSNGEDLGLPYYARRLEEMLNEAINLRLRSDVPLGIFLSGGLDSSSVVALLAPRVPQKLKTYSVAYDYGDGFNETPYAHQVSKQFDTDHHEYFMSPGDFRSFVPEYVKFMDEPVTEAAAISLYFISRLAKDDVTVVLSGEGSDELFAGYDFYLYNLLISRTRGLLGRKWAGGFCGAIRPFVRHAKTAKYLDMLQRPLEDRYRGISTYQEAKKRELYTEEFQQVSDEISSADEFIRALFEKTAHLDTLSRMLYFDTRTWLVDDLLIKADRMSMAASLELRVPFLDHRLVEFAATVPSKYKISGKITKHLLKCLMKDRLPEWIVNRKKMGFPTPLEIMFRGELFDYAADTLLSTPAMNRGYFKGKGIRRLLDEHRTRTGSHHEIIWQLLVLEEWHRQFA